MPPDLYKNLHAEFGFDFDACPNPLPNGFNGLDVEWGNVSFVNPPFYKTDAVQRGTLIAFIRKAIEQQKKGKTSVLALPCFIRDRSTSWRKLAPKSGRLAELSGWTLIRRKRRHTARLMRRCSSSDRGTGGRRIMRRPFDSVRHFLLSEVAVRTDRLDPFDLMRIAVQRRAAHLAVIHFDVVFLPNSHCTPPSLIHSRKYFDVAAHQVKGAGIMLVWDHVHPFHADSIYHWLRQRAARTRRLIGDRQTPPSETSTTTTSERLSTHRSSPSKWRGASKLISRVTR